MRQVQIILALCFVTIKIFAQTKTCGQIEDELHQSYKKILSYRFGTATIEQDSLEAENEIFRNKIGLYTSKFPLTITCSFDSLKKDNIDIVTTDDKLFRIYSWNTWLGGTMHDFGNVYQYKSAGQVYSKTIYIPEADSDYVPFYSQIFTLKANSKIYYLAVYNGIYSTKDASQSIRVFTINNESLNSTTKLFKTKEGFTNSIEVTFDFFSVVDRPERPLRLIKYDRNSRTIYIPIVLKNGKVTERYILYKFTGQYFEYIKNNRSN